MKAASLALACALLGATAFIPAAMAQTPSEGARAPAEASPSTASPGRDRARDEGDRFAGMGRDDGFLDMDEDDMMTGSRRPRGADRFGDDRMGGSRQEGARMGPEAIRRMIEAHQGLQGGARGARLKLKRGDSSIDIRCPSGENIATCVEAVGRLMDRLQAMPQTSTTIPAAPNR